MRGVRGRAGTGEEPLLGTLKRLSDDRSSDRRGVAKGSACELEAIKADDGIVVGAEGADHGPH